ncbi:DNA replication and repair protein RecF [Frankia canadensis]|uniref:DNA replication and repair protein RecF n=1 Tax=Frankia canadensis TaxID=1836972 RepID=A0A2I2L0J0_9ACTN|nr:DNA replication/repair protein RecF [Frankia canadensis]SNQ51419.1 DNA replication and repair protein RecF [Frankia canadensis]SOU58709.1 DNA replication and repair protein RecF [Frankia canadensis]
MHLTHLSLVDFRSYPALDLTLGPGAVTFIGGNGQGKTNLIEAIGYVATLASHRVAGDAPLVRDGAEQAIVRARIVRGDRAALVELEIVPGRANRARLNRAPVSRTRDVLGLLCVVLFAPEDLALVKGDPAGRRQFLDDLLVARAPRMAAVLADYDRVVRQRSTLLRTAGAARRAGGRGDLRTLEVWDGYLATHGAELLAARLALVEALRPAVADAYTAVAGASSPVALEYRSSVPLPEGGAGPDLPAAAVPDRTALAEAIHAALAAARAREIERGMTLVGPHRDDLLLSIAARPARGYASHGESWSLALALRLASFDLLRADDREPVLLLDDVFAELDTRRRARLAELVAPAEQVLVTAAVESDVPAELAGTRFHVADSEVRRAG